MKQDLKLNLAKSRLSVGYTKNNHVFSQFWEANQTFNKVNQSRKNNGYGNFVLLDGPPYANGNLHVGHALNKTFKDLVVKSRWFLGKEVDFRPGWDCHGLPLELAVEKKYGRQDVDKLKEGCKQLALDSVAGQMKGFKDLGVLGEWENPYLTMSDDMVRNDWATLADLVKKDLLVYKQFPVHYCPDCASSLAEAELEKENLPKDSLYFLVNLTSSTEKNLKALVWTTTPWTLPMNQALAYHKDFTYEVWVNPAQEKVVLQNPEQVTVWLQENNYTFERKCVFEELNVSHETSPLSLMQAPVLQADFVEEGMTGFVHMACAHGAEDFELGVQNGLLPKTYLNKYAVFEVAEDLPFACLNGKKKDKVAQDVVELLKANNLFVAYSQGMAEQNVCWRHKKGVFYNATWQVFLDLENPSYHLKDKVREHLAKSNMPQKNKEQLGLMLLNRKHWCLSRQRSWGCPMNLLVDKETNEVSSLSAQYLSLLGNGNDSMAQELLEQNPNLKVFTDVLDVWFDSGNVVNYYNAKNGSQSKDFVVDLALEGKDQYRGWFQAMLWLCVAKYDKMPYANLFCHGFVLDADRKKYSKSSNGGKGLDYYFDKFGADTLHLWVANQNTEQDAVFSEAKLQEMNVVYSRLRLSLRFLTSNLENYNKQEHESNLEKYWNEPGFDFHRFMLKKMADVAKTFQSNFENYEFKEPLDNLYQFAEGWLSNFYFDWAKNPFYLQSVNSAERKMLETGSYEVLRGFFDLVKVYAPFVAEEFYQDFYNNGKSVFEEFYFTKEKMEQLLKAKVDNDFAKVKFLRGDVQGEVEKLQQKQEVKSRTEVNTLLNLEEGEYKLLTNVGNYHKLGDLMAVSNVFLQKRSNQTDNKAKVTLFNLRNDPDYCKCPRCWNYEPVNKMNKESGLCPSCEDSVNN